MGRKLLVNEVAWEGRGGEGREGTRTRMMLVMRRECWFLIFAWILE